MRQRGLGLVIALVYIAFLSAVMLITARLVSNVTKVAKLIETSQANAQFETFALEKLRTDCFAAKTLSLETQTWLRIDSNTMWFIDDAGLRRLDANGDVQVFPTASKSSRFDQSNVGLKLHIRDRTIALPQLRKEAL